MAGDIIERELRRLHARHVGDDGGRMADYIPELAKADPSWFGISFCTVDGHVYDTGDADRAFTIQSVSKPFVYALALAERGPGDVLERIGVEPSGDAFNSIVLDARDRPHNPMINAGAIATVGMIPGGEGRFERIRDILGRFAGRPLEVDVSVYESESATGHRNRAIAHLMRNVGVIDDDVDRVLDDYFRQCSVLVTSTDLAVMMATLAARGRNPITGEQVVSETVVGDVLSVMFTSGMYDYSGEWAYGTGLPAKSGVAGGVGTLVPDQVGVGVFSPRLDERGNSVRGLNVSRDLSERLGFHVFRNRVDAMPPIRSLRRGDSHRSSAVRPLRQSEALDRHGARIAVVTAQGTWSFVACERLSRIARDTDADYLVLDLGRVGAMDRTAAVLMAELIEALEARGTVVTVAGSVPAALADLTCPRFAGADQALEWCEDRLLGALGLVDEGTLAFEACDLGRGLDPSEAAAVMSVGTARDFGAGEVLVDAGTPGASMFLVVRGHLDATVGDLRVASFGPGSIVGEMSFLTGEARSATITAARDTHIVEFDDFSALPADLQAKLLRNVSVVLAHRLGTANRSLAEAVA